MHLLGDPPPQNFSSHDQTLIFSFLLHTIGPVNGALLWTMLLHKISVRAGHYGGLLCLHGGGHHPGLRDEGPGKG